tara:strand:+ start:88 stop:618 length:531 start_codon:yes stop_codon:yes gene_type:complete
MRFSILVIVGLLIFNGTGNASEIDNLSDYKGIKSVRVVIWDRVVQGCWESSKFAEILVEKELLSSGISVGGNDWDVQFVIWVDGQAIITAENKKIGCTAGYHAEIMSLARAKPDYSTKSNVFKIILWDDNGLIVSPKHDLSNVLNDKIRQFAIEFAVKVLKAKVLKKTQRYALNSQ